MTDQEYVALYEQQERLRKGLEAINEERVRRGMLPTIMLKVLAPELGVFNEQTRSQS